MEKLSKKILNQIIGCKFCFPPDWIMLFDRKEETNLYLNVSFFNLIYCLD